MTLRERAAAIRLMAFDIDGVMTDGGLTYDNDGREQKTFDVQDGLGIKLLQRVGIETAIVTGRTSGVVAARAADLAIPHVFQGCANKRLAVASLLDQLGLAWHQCAFMGDDLIDLPVMAHCGLAIAPANARQVVAAAAHLVTRAAGGQGAVREAIDQVLDAQGHFDALVASFRNA